MPLPKPITYGDIRHAKAYICSAPQIGSGSTLWTADLGNSSMTNYCAATDITNLNTLTPKNESKNTAEFIKNILSLF